MNLTKYIGKPFKTYGAGPDYYDCYGLVRAVLADMGIVIPNYEYRADTLLEVCVLIDAIEATTTEWHSVDYPIPGDVVLLGLVPRRFSHIGAMTEEGIIHTTLKTGVILQTREQILRGMFRNMRFYRWAP